MAQRPLGEQSWMKEYEEFFKRVDISGEGDANATPKRGDACVCVVCINSTDAARVMELSDDMAGYENGAITTVTIGAADCFIGKHFEKVLLTMRAGEKAFIRSKADYITVSGQKRWFFKPRGQHNFNFYMQLRAIRPASDREVIEV